MDDLTRFNDELHSENRSFAYWFQVHTDPKKGWKLQLFSEISCNARWWSCTELINHLKTFGTYDDFKKLLKESEHFGFNYLSSVYEIHMVCVLWQKELETLESEKAAGLETHIVQTILLFFRNWALVRFSDEVFGSCENKRLIGINVVSPATKLKAMVDLYINRLSSDEQKEFHGLVSQFQSMIPLFKEKYESASTFFIQERMHQKSELEKQLRELEARIEAEKEHAVAYLQNFSIWSGRLDPPN